MKDDHGCDLTKRTKAYALRIIRLYAAMPRRAEAEILGRQVLRSGTSVGAHYREACRARSTAEFISKIEGGLQELEESLYWLELLGESQIVKCEKLVALVEESQELIAILVACVKSAKLKIPVKKKARCG